MDRETFCKRLSQLRISKGVSARDMSLSIGQSPNYINVIEGGKNYPSMESFFYICEYFGITPQEFFDRGNLYPAQLGPVVEDLKNLDQETLAHVAALVRRLAQHTQKA